MYSTILVPVDLAHDDVGRRILKKGAALLREGGVIHALFVASLIPDYAEAHIPREVRETEDRASYAALEALAAEMDIPAQVRVTHGAAAASILDAAKTVDADLVIIGSHRPGIADYFLGSTAARVVRHAPCSVLVDR